MKGRSLFMIKVNVIAENKDGVKLGERVIDKAQTMAELVEQFEEKDIISMVYRSFVIDIQRELRADAMKGAPTDKSKVLKMIEAATKALKAGDSTLYDALVDAGIVDVS